jgi:enoyl-CoA hydratase
MYLSQVLGGAMQAGFATEVVTMQSEDHRRRLLEFEQRSSGHDLNQP